MVLLNEPKKNKFAEYITDVLITSISWPYRCIFLRNLIKLLKYDQSRAIQHFIIQEMLFANQGP